MNFLATFFREFASILTFLTNKFYIVGRRDRDRMIFGYTSTCVTSAWASAPLTL